MTKGKYKSSSNTWSVFFTANYNIITNTNTDTNPTYNRIFWNAEIQTMKRRQIKKTAKFSQQREQKNKYKYKWGWGVKNKSPE